MSLSACRVLAASGLRAGPDSHSRTGQGDVVTRLAMSHPEGMSVLLGTLLAGQGDHSAPGFLPLTKLHVG